MIFDCQTQSDMDILGMDPELDVEEEEGQRNDELDHIPHVLRSCPTLEEIQVRFLLGEEYILPKIDQILQRINRGDQPNGLGKLPCPLLNEVCFYGKFSLGITDLMEFKERRDETLRENSEVDGEIKTLTF